MSSATKPAMMTTNRRRWPDPIGYSFHNGPYATHPLVEFVTRGLSDAGTHGAAEPTGRGGDPGFGFGAPSRVSGAPLPACFPPARSSKFLV